MNISGVIREFVDFVYPTRCPGCGRYLLPDEEGVCADCLMEVSLGVPAPFCRICGRKMDKPGMCRECKKGRYFSVARAVTGASPIAMGLVRAVKYVKRPNLGRKLGGIMGDFARGRVEFSDVDVVVPVPIHWWRRFLRGFNQSEMFADLIGEKMGIPVFSKAVVRIKNTPSQTFLDKNQRRENVKDCFAVKEPDLISGKVVLVVDDVFTTGSTVDELARVLLEGGAKDVKVLTFTSTPAVKVKK